MNPGLARSHALAALPLVVAIGACNSSSGTGDSADPGDVAFADPIGDTAVTIEEPDTDTDVQSGSASRFGLIEISHPTGELDDGFAAASFVRFAAPRSYELLIAELLPPLDGCTITRTAPSSGEATLDDGNPGTDGPIGAGETITFSSAEGTWLTLTRDIDFDIEYINERALPLPLPFGLVLDIPGDEFPAFTDAPIRDVAPVVRASANGTEVGPDETFRWTAPDAPSETVLVRIDMLALDDSGTVTAIDCLATDDGEFTLPPEVRASLADDFSASATLTRFGITALRQDDALLMVTVESAVD